MVQREPSFARSVLGRMVRCAGRALGRRGEVLSGGAVRAGAVGAESSFEALEARQLMAAISWDGGGDGVLWSDARNWSGDVLPGPTSDVTINVAAANPVIQYTEAAGARTINSLVTHEGITFTGGQLTLTTTATVLGNAPITIGSATATGPTLSGGVWNVTEGSGGRILSVGNSTIVNSRIVGRITVINTDFFNLNLRLTNANIDGEILIQSRSNLRISGNTTYAALRYTGTNFFAQINFETDHVLAGDITIDGSNIPAFFVGTSAGVTLTIPQGRRIECLQFGELRFEATLRVVNNGLVAVPGGGSVSINSTQAAQLPGELLLGNGSLLRIENLEGQIGTLTTTGSLNSIVINGGTYTISAPLRLNSSNGVSTLRGTATLASTLTLVSGRLELLGTWNNLGTIGVEGGVLGLGGTFARSAIGTISRAANRTAGTIEVSGVLDNSNSVMNLREVLGPWRLSGTIRGGAVSPSIDFPSSFGSVITFAPGGTFEDVQITEELTLASNGLRLRGNTRFPMIRLADFGAGVSFVPGYVLRDTILSEGIEGERRIDITATGTLTIGPTGRIIAVGATASLVVGQASGSGIAMTLVNEGTIAAEALGQSVRFTVASFSNAATGRIRVGNSGILSIQNFSGPIGDIAASRSATFSILSGTYSIPSALSVRDGSYSLAGTYTINGAVTVESGSISLLGSWTVNGALIVNGGTLNLGGTLPTSVVNRVTRGGNGTAGAVNIVGTINNASNVLAFTQATGVWGLGTPTTPGVISGGSISFAPGLFLGIGANAQNSLQNVAINGEIRFVDVGSRVSISGTTTFQIARLWAPDSRLVLPSNWTIPGDIIGDGPLGGQRSIEISGSLTVPALRTISTAVGSNASLEITGGSAVNVQGTLRAGSESGQFAFPVTPISMLAGGRLLVERNARVTLNQVSGQLNAITLSGPLASFSIRGGTYTFASGLTIDDGQATLGGTWTNAGIIRINGGTLNFNTGTATSRIGTIQRANGGTAGTVNIVGTFTNTSSTLAITPETGSWNLGSASGQFSSIEGGTVTIAPGLTLPIRGTSTRLANVTVLGEITLETPNSVIELSGTTTFLTARMSAPSTRMRYTAENTLQGNVIVSGSASGFAYIEARTSLTIAPGAIIRTERGSNLRLVLTWNTDSQTNVINSGTISIEGVGLSFFETPRFTNNGTVSVGDGASFRFNSTTNISNFVSGVLTGGVWSAVGSGVLNLNRTVTANDATVTLSGVGGAAASPSFHSLNVNNGTLALRAVAGAGSGTFTIEPAGGTFTNNGTLLIGAENRLAITGAFAQAAGGATVVEIGGTGASQYGRLSVTGAAAVGGAVTLTLVNNFALTRYDRFDFISAGSVSGRFGSVTLPPRIDADSKQLMLYGETDVTYAESHVADFNSNGIVDFFDYLDFINVFEQNGDGADFNGNGTIDFFDYLDFLEKFDRA
jgi:hypothetical protein